MSCGLNIFFHYKTIYLDFFTSSLMTTDDWWPTTMPIDNNEPVPDGWEKRLPNLLLILSSSPCMMWILNSKFWFILFYFSVEIWIIIRNWTLQLCSLNFSLSFTLTFSFFWRTYSRKIIIAKNSFKSAKC